jgi:hypothetical protein
VTKRGLGDMEPGGGSAEVELLGDGDEVPQQAEIEPGQIACIDRRNLLIRQRSVLDAAGRRQRR